MMNTLDPWIRADLGFTLDFRQSGLSPDDLEALAPALAAAHREMQALEAGVVKNLDEYRQVTHFTDRRSYLDSPLFAAVEGFFDDLVAGRLVGATGKPFRNVVINGIGGSALGPQLLQFAINGPYWNELSLAQRRGRPRLYFLDNTDPAGPTDVLAVVDPEETLLINISKSGATRETTNNLLAFARHWAARKLAFAPHVAAITMGGSQLDQQARREGWLKVWPMAESIGGRTSETAIVGHVPAAAGGIDFRSLLTGALTMDEWTRTPEPRDNPAYLLAAAWYKFGDGRGERSMVIVPYADRLVLLSRYLQQLVMESLGKERDRAGRVVNQGLTVYGNKGGTDAHAYIQQLNDGPDDFFITFVEVLRDAAPIPLEGALTMGDYLHNFRQGLANALQAKGRRVLSLTVEDLNPQALGMLIALFERAVAVYAELININAFHQPGVEAYKQLSNRLNQLSLRVQEVIANGSGLSGGAEVFAGRAGLAGLEAEVDGLLAKYTLNQRVFKGQTLRRELVKGRWYYRVVPASASGS